MLKLKILVLLSSVFVSYACLRSQENTPHFIILSAINLTDIPISSRVTPISKPDKNAKLYLFYAYSKSDCINVSDVNSFEGGKRGVGLRVWTRLYLFKTTNCTGEAYIIDENCSFNLCFPPSFSSIGGPSFPYDFSEERDLDILNSCEPEERTVTLVNSDNTTGYKDQEEDYTHEVSAIHTSSNTKGSSFSNTYASGASVEVGVDVSKSSTLGGGVGSQVPPLNLQKFVSVQMTWRIFQKFASHFSQTSCTAYNWSNSSQFQESSRTVRHRKILVPTCVRTVLIQIAGVCGPFSVKTEKLIRTDYDRYGNAFGSHFIFNPVQIGNVSVSIPGSVLE
ncbi:uncharacterized protein LOC118435093 [Folsomia candida]|uniref:uncharacterized protein LOC118435093 n=1 Tax=Folsomia candida TaxID=158441 RepID=UPI001604A2B8|nr:uncharacterized protein LOC118435093 [Folsomia candida]